MPFSVKTCENVRFLAVAFIKGVVMRTIVAIIAVVFVQYAWLSSVVAVDKQSFDKKIVAYYNRLVP